MIDSIKEWKEKSTLFLFIGNVASYQGVNYFVDEFKYLVEKLNHDIKLLIVGNGDEMGLINHIIRRDKLDNRFKHIDYIEEYQINEICKISDVGLSIFSPHRGLPGTISGLKTFSYLLNGLPIITSLMDDKADMISSEKFGWVINDFSKKSLQNIFSNAIIEKEKMKKNIDLSKEHLISKYQWKNRYEICKSSIENNFI